MIIRGGENIGCGQVEEALAAFPQITEAAVFAVPDERLGEEVGAAIYAEPGLELTELRTFLASRLAQFQIPKQVAVFAEPLPRTASGKIDKLALARQSETRAASLRGPGTS